MKVGDTFFGPDGEPVVAVPEVRSGIISRCKAADGTMCVWRKSRLEPCSFNHQSGSVDCVYDGRSFVFIPEVTYLNLRLIGKL